MYSGNMCIRGTCTQDVMLGNEIYADLNTFKVYVKHFKTEFLQIVIIPRLKVFKQVIICLITCLSLFISEPSLRLLRERMENQL